MPRTINWWAVTALGLVVLTGIPFILTLVNGLLWLSGFAAGEAMLWPAIWTFASCAFALVVIGIGGWIA